MLSFNQSKFLKEAVNSVLEQEWDEHWQIIIHDDASTDDSSSVIREMQKANPEKITAVLQSKNLYSRQVNIPIEIQNLVNSKYVARLDGDDVFISKSKLVTQLAILEEDEGISLVSHRYAIINEEGKITKLVKYKIGEFVGRYLLLLGNPIATPTAMYRSAAIGILPEEFSNSQIQDWPLWVILSSRGKVAYKTSLLSGYRIHSSNGFARKNNLQFKEDILLVHKMLWRCSTGMRKYFSGIMYLITHLSFTFSGFTLGYSVRLINKFRSLLMGYREVNA